MPHCSSLEEPHITNIPLGISQKSWYLFTVSGITRISKRCAERVFLFDPQPDGHENITLVQVIGKCAEVVELIKWPMRTGMMHRVVERIWKNIKWSLLLYIWIFLVWNMFHSLLLKIHLDRLLEGACHLVNGLYSQLYIYIYVCGIFMEYSHI